MVCLRACLDRLVSSTSRRQHLLHSEEQRRAERGHGIRVRATLQQPRRAPQPAGQEGTVQASDSVCASLHQRLFAHGAADLPRLWHPGWSRPRVHSAGRRTELLALRMICLACAEVGCVFGHHVYMRRW